MKRIITVAAFAFTVILGVGKSQAQVPAVQVTVPFKFTAGDKALPAGAYTIMLASSGVIEIRNRAQHISVTSMVLPENTQAESGGELVFTRYGNQYFLHQILCEYPSMNVHLPQARAEKWIRREEAKVQNASQVFLALNSPK